MVNRKVHTVRQLPSAEPRVETGPIVFGNDWPGTFIRGDNAFNYAQHLLNVLDGERPSLLSYSRLTVYALLDVLQSSDVAELAASPAVTTSADRRPMDMFSSAVDVLRCIAAMGTTPGSETAQNWLLSHGFALEEGGYIPGKGFE